MLHRWSVVLGEVSPQPGLAGLTGFSGFPSEAPTDDTEVCDTYYVLFKGMYKGKLEIKALTALPQHFSYVRTSKNNSAVPVTVNLF